MEGQRFFDLRRWDIADDVLNGYLNGVAVGREETRRLYLAQRRSLRRQAQLVSASPRFRSS